MLARGHKEKNSGWIERVGETVAMLRLRSMDNLQNLLERNSHWAQRKVAADPQFFQRLVDLQTPKYLWIGCSDSRVPANEIVDLPPGELFVHRNVANVADREDVNCQSVIEFAVDAIKVEHIMVVGHYGCSGVRAALGGRGSGVFTERWLDHVRKVAVRYQDILQTEPEEKHRASLLCELNVLEQTLQVCTSVPVLRAWRRGQPLTIHGWIYRLKDGRIRHLDFSVNQEEDPERLREQALQSIRSARRESLERVRAKGLIQPRTA